MPILLLINVIAMASIFFSLRRFWTIGYAHRWRYLVVAAAALVLLVAFTIYDISKIGSGLRLSAAGYTTEDTEIEDYG